MIAGVAKVSIKDWQVGEANNCYVLVVFFHFLEIKCFIFLCLFGGM